ncbi:MAG: bifunctional anthranilate synthase component II/anthranilate phosphoribosyltransferase [Oscillospiraceae bacterium]|nr:bifunctional anthranilate synthase component II/anthranilate phosphoribosyltransferase [Oscillospiraceae bacterium]
MILMIDNYDSFTYNLYQLIGTLYSDIKVVRNDEITIEEIEKMKPEALIISPGPGYPADAGISVEAIRRFSGEIPILGICLGHQAIAEAFGGKIIRAKMPMHGKGTEISINTDCPIFAGLPEKVTAARYHSLVVDVISLPVCLRVTATDGDGQIMALRHKEHPTYGVQFHPESILTEHGAGILSAFLCDVAGIKNADREVISMPKEKRTALKKYIAKAADGCHLTEEEAENAMNIIMSDGATDAQIAALLTAMRCNGETIEEITGFARIMRRKASIVPSAKSAVDIVGTGGDVAGTFNISTTSSFVIAGAGLNVAKHGNRSVSSKSGAADVLEALGVKLNLTPAKASACMKEAGIAFLFAQSFHKAMRFVAPARRETGIRTGFNILGPLANPALSDYILLGVYDERLLEIMAKVLMNLGVKGAMIVYGGGLDEVTVSGITTVCELRDRKLIKYEINPEDYGIKIAPKSEIVGGSPADNAKITLDILTGKEKGAKRDIVLLNAGCAIYCTGAAASIEDGIKMARKSIDSGMAYAKFEKMREFTNRA